MCVEMPTLLAKIESDAAARLPLPAGRQPAEELARYKTFLKVETHRLKILHRAGASGREICRARAQILDVLIRYLWEAAKSSLSLQAQKEFPPLALIAIGGYGRAELNPHSDIDFMFLHAGQVVSSGKPLPHLAKIIDGTLYPLWDIGLKVGHSVRNIEDCVKVANSDMQSKTSLIESRLITGDEVLFNKYQKTVLSRCVEGQEDKFIAERLADQAARHAKFGNSACMQEPNIKNGCGGLRDHQNLLWMAYFKYRTRSLKELQQRELISDGERKQLEAAYDYLLRVRNELHYHNERPVDALARNLQPAIAHNLGYTDRSASKRLEKFMGDVYTHARNIYLINRTLEQRLALLPSPRRLKFFSGLVGGRPSVQPEVDGLKFLDGYIQPGSLRIFRDQPRRLMRVFLYAQQRGLKLHPDLAQLIRNQLALVDRAFLTDEHVRETFLTILNQRGNVGQVLRAMHDVGLLGKYIPEFGKLTCLVQHEFYHRYTADEHTLVCLEELDRVWEAKAPPAQSYAPVFQSLERPFVLYLALLLHDTGKADGHGRHSEVGGKIAVRVAKRLGLDAATTQTLNRVIEHHLLMASTSQRRDLEDRTVIRSFAKQVETPETLNLLTLHTFVDSLATSDKLWNGFKDSLLWTLHLKTMQLLTGGTEFLRAEEKQRERLAEEVRGWLPEQLSEEELDAHFTALPPRYFQIHTAREIVDDLLLTHRFMRLQIAEVESPLEPVVNWHNEPDRGYTAVKICTWDRAGLFSNIAGSFSACGLNILSAQIFTRKDGIALDTFFVTDAKTGLLADQPAREKFESLLFNVLTGGEVDFHKLIERQRIHRPSYQSLEGERIPTRIHIDNEMSEGNTVIEIETEDRLGLLYVISQTLTGLDLNISVAKICTEKGAAIDTFYVAGSDGQKVHELERQRQVERSLRAALAALDP
jgi:[protein-PII] uridylyltransferase